MLRNNYRTLFAISFLVLVFYLSKVQSYMLFHTFVELFSVVVAFAVFIVTWNSRQMHDNRYLQLVGISYIFIGALDLLHTLTYKGMNIIPVDGHPANQFWVATRFLETITLLFGFFLINKRTRLRPDWVFLSYFVASALIILSILVWKNFPVCYIDGVGQTAFKLWMEYIIIAILLLVGYLLIKNRKHFSTTVFRLLLLSLVFTIVSEFCFTQYVFNYSAMNELGHYAKLVAFFLIYKANVETSFIRPTDIIFKNLKDNEKKYRTLAENMPGFILRFNSQLECIYANVKEERQQPEGQTILKYQISQDKSLEVFLMPLVRRAQQTEAVQQSNFDLDGANGKEFYVVQVIPEYHNSDVEASYLVICQDITALKHSENQLQALNQTKDKLFSIIAHDLKNPFTSLLSFSELIQRNAYKMDGAKIEHMAGRMNESAKQAFALLENLLNWSRVQTGTLKPVSLAIEVDDLFDESSRLLTALAQSKSIALVFEQSVDLVVIADRQMAATVLRNLISNAIKFSYPESRVYIQAKEQDCVVLFSITDHGIGVAPEHSENLFEIGNTFSSLGTASEEGTGLGLVLCKEFVEMNGGEIWLESELGKGTTFYFTLPV
ncbi:MASE3 domain-containing protein [Pedobacter sp. AW1-32]|uniref:MASE3 domain-containing protein n=1 Tax=Pedobacter sp. AW1-32 TaxID=3383026 RepID=UPI003FF10068